MSESVGISAYTSIYAETCMQEPNFDFAVNAACKEITESGVIYEDADGVAHTVEAGTVILACGMKSQPDLVMSYYGKASRTREIGDCATVGAIQSAVRTAFAAASAI